MKGPAYATYLGGNSTKMAILYQRATIVLQGCACHVRSYLLTRDAFGFDDEEDDGPAMLMDGGIVDSNDSSSRQTPGEDTGGTDTRKKDPDISRYIQTHTHTHIGIYI